MAQLKRRPQGRPPLPSTLWLAARLSVGDDPARMYAEWQRIHAGAVGFQHADPRRSYKAALTVARRRITST
jgi:hypothetical protein